jgi:hypothetical protein
MAAAWNLYMGFHLMEITNVSLEVGMWNSLWVYIINKPTFEFILEF